MDSSYNKLSHFSSIERLAYLGGTQSVVLSTYSYDQAHCLPGLSHEEDTTTLVDYDWTYDKLNRVTSFTSLADGMVAGHVPGVPRRSLELATLHPRLSSGHRSRFYRPQRAGPQVR